MTEVLKRWIHCGFLAGFLVAAGLLANGQNSASEQSSKAPGHPAESLYFQIQNLGLDPSRVYRVRDVAIDRSAIHITLENGTIAFTQDIARRVTGAFFEGDGEVLLSPPNQVERTSMALFTGGAILEEKFVSAYFRFNDDTFVQLQPSLRPATNQDSFISLWDGPARKLSDADALRIFATLSKSLPETVTSASTEPVSGSGGSTDRFFHARIEGRQRGDFDLYFDSQASEQVRAGQASVVDELAYYDLWTSFSVRPTTMPSGENAESAVSDESTSMVNISNFKIVAEIRPPTEIKATATLQMKVNRSGERTIVFELSRSLNVESVEVDGQPVEFIHNQALEGSRLARRGNDLVAVVFPRTLKAGDHHEVRFKYGGEVLSAAGGGLLYVGARGVWYPNLGITHSDFDLTFRYPLGWTLVATGKKAGETSAENGEGMQASHWTSEKAIPLAGFNLGKYVKASAPAGTVTVEAFAAPGVENNFPKPARSEIPFGSSSSHPRLQEFPSSVPYSAEPPPPPPSPAKNAQAVADSSARAIDFFAQRFGPFPYSDLKLTQMPGQLSQGWPGLVFLSTISYLTDRERSDIDMSPINQVLARQMLVHETAHQWWGDLVGWSGYRDQWIMEALANYTALMELEQKSPKQFHQVLEQYREDLFQKNKDGAAIWTAGPVTVGLRLSNSHFPDGYDAISYGRGTWLFHMLRCMMQESNKRRETRSQSTPAEEPFIRALRKLREQYAGKSISNAELLKPFEEELPPSALYEGHRSLDWFYTGWINGVSIPHFSTKNVKFTDRPHSTAVTGVITQTDAPDDLVTSVPVYAEVNRSLVMMGRVFADGPETTFHLNAPTGTRRIVLDPEQTILSQNH